MSQHPEQVVWKVRDAGAMLNADKELIGTVLAQGICGMIQANLSPANAATAADSRKQRHTECYKRAVHLATCERNHDYAHALFADLVVQDPGSPQFVESMIQNLRMKTPNRQRSIWRRRQGGSRALMKAIKQKEWIEVIRQGLGVLKVDPWDVATLRGMAEAVAALHHNEVELLYLKQALDAEPKNVEVNRHCARSLGRMGQFDQAIACWHRVEEIKGGEREAAEMISRLTEQKMNYLGGKRMISTSGCEQLAASKLDTVCDETSERQVLTSLQTESEIPLSLRQRLERAIHTDSADVTNYLGLAELLCEIGQFDNAERTLVQALECCAQRLPAEEALQWVRKNRSATKREAVDIEHQNQLRAERCKFRMPWLELSLLPVGVALLFQIFPSWWTTVSDKLFDYAQILLFMANILVLLLLVAWHRKTTQ